MLNEKAIKTYLRKKFRNVSRIKIRKLGSGVQGAGFLAEIKTKKGLKSYVIKSLSPKRGNLCHKEPEPQTWQRVGSDTKIDIIADSKYIDPGAIFDMMALTVIYFGLQRANASRRSLS